MAAGLFCAFTGKFGKPGMPNVFGIFAAFGRLILFSIGLLNMGIRLANCGCRTLGAVGTAMAFGGSTPMFASRLGGNINGVGWTIFGSGEMFVTVELLSVLSD